MSSQQPQSSVSDSSRIKLEPRSAGGPLPRRPRVNQEKVKLEPRSAGAPPPKRHSNGSAGSRNDPRGGGQVQAQPQLINKEERRRRQEQDRKRTTADNERAMAELIEAGIAVRDFQVEADAKPSQEDLEMAEHARAERETAEKRMEEARKKQARPVLGGLHDRVERWRSMIGK